MVLFFFFLVFAMVFVVFSWLLVVLLGCYSGFDLLTTKTTEKTKKNHEFLDFAR